MKDSVICLYKKIGETPLQRLNRLRVEDPRYENEILTYAGRLDPMAEGLLLVLVGEENKNRDKYLGLNKEYIFEAVFGVSSDTYDVLGKVITSPYNNIDVVVLNEFVSKALEKFKGKIKQEYPPFSSKPVLGKPLFVWAKEGRISEIDLPTSEIEIFNIELLSDFSINRNDFQKKILEMIATVSGDFRQDEIIEEWNKFFQHTKKTDFFGIRAKVYCSSGTYIRGIVNNLGNMLGCGAVATKILRTKIGEFELKD
jgi:tRNA pseudouridine55 synthase